MTSVTETGSFGGEWKEIGKHCLKCLVPGLLKVQGVAVLKGRARLPHACVGIGCAYNFAKSQLLSK